MRSSGMLAQTQEMKYHLRPVGSLIINPCCIIASCAEIWFYLPARLAVTDIDNAKVVDGAIARQRFGEMRRFNKFVAHEIDIPERSLSFMNDNAVLIPDRRAAPRCLGLGQAAVMFGDTLVVFGH